MKKILTKYLVVLISVFLGVLFIMPSSIMAYTFPSTNELNKTQQAPGHVGQLVPYVNLVEASVGKVKLDFVGGFVGGAYFEYRIDGVVVTSGTPQPVTGDFEYPGVWVVANTTVQREISANEKVEVRLALGGERDWDFDWTTFTVLPQPVAEPAAPAGNVVFTITASTGGNGSITDPGAFNINVGAQKIYTMTPDSGFVVADVLVNGVSVTAVTSYLMTGIAANQTINVTFSSAPAPAVAVAAITTGTLEVAAITELPRTGNNMLFYVIGFALMAVGVAFGSVFIPKALRKR